MTTPAAVELIKKIQNDLNKKGFKPKELVKQLKELRPYAIKEEDPLVTKVIRLTYEHIEAHESFKLRPTGGEESDEEVEVEIDTDNDAENINYLVQLVLNPKNPYNREELQELRDMLLS